MKIIKIGGTALFNANDINTFMEGQNKGSSPTLYVISAFAMLSSELKYFAENAQNNQDLTNPIGKFTDLYHILNSEQCKIFTQFLGNVSININRLVVGTRKTGEVPKIIVDEIMSFGELLSSYFIYCLFLSNEIMCQFVDARKLIVTDSNYGNATPNLDLSVANIRNSVDSNTIIITQGFIGSDNNGKTTTMGFESSNLSATIFAKAMDATEIEIIMKVKQIYTSDPEVDSTSLPVTAIPYESAKLLATNNFKLMFAGMIEIASSNNITLVYRGLDMGYRTIVSENINFGLPVILISESRIIVTPITKGKAFEVFGELMECVQTFNYNIGNYSLELLIKDLDIDEVQTRIISLF